MFSVESVAAVGVAALLLWAAAAKLSARTVSGGWLAAYGVPAPLRRPALIALALAETVTGAFLLLGFRGAALAAVGLGIMFTAALAHAWGRGLRRLSCGCFGAKERGLPFLIARALAFTALAALAAFGRGIEVSRETFVFIALAVLALAVILLSLLVLALARQVGVLTLRLGPGVALEIEEEGPAVGQPAPLLDGLRGRGSELVAFFTEDCRLCRELAPAVRALAREGVPVHIVYEAEEPDAFRQWRVPGTPFAVHVVDGAVTAKGTVNTLEQLDGLLATGAARAQHAPA